jgi:hypothetical protein
VSEEILSALDQGTTAGDALLLRIDPAPPADALTRLLTDLPPATRQLNLSSFPEHPRMPGRGRAGATSPVSIGAAARPRGGVSKRSQSDSPAPRTKPKHSSARTCAELMSPLRPKDFPAPPLATRRTATT